MDGREPKLTAKRHARGVLCLANDGAEPWMTSFFESFRSHEPDLPLTIIPYDDRLEVTASLADRYGASIHDDSLFEQLDQLGEQFAPHNRGRRHLFRKFAAFWGPYDSFCFLDTDVILVGPIHPWFDARERADVDLAYCDASLDAVYPPGPFQDEMRTLYGSTGWNSGTFVSRTGLVDIAQVRATVVDAKSHLRELTRWDGEMSLMNYLVDTRRWTVARLGDLDEQLNCACWASQRTTTQSRDPAWKSEVLDADGRRLTLLHWAGFRPSPLMPNADVFLRYRLAPLSRRSRAWFRLVAWPYAGLRLLAARAKGQAAALSRSMRPPLSR